MCKIELEVDKRNIPRPPSQFFKCFRLQLLYGFRLHPQLREKAGPELLGTYWNGLVAPYREPCKFGLAGACLALTGSALKAPPRSSHRRFSESLDAN